MTNDLKTLNLTERDFQLMVDGLDCLPNKNMAGEMMGDLLIGLIAKDDDEAQEKFKRERELDRAKRQREKDGMVEDIKILQGKLLMLKRYLIENSALKETVNIINHVQ